jgi:hypothetical protein
MANKQIYFETHQKSLESEESEIFYIFTLNSNTKKSHSTKFLVLFQRARLFDDLLYRLCVMQKSQLINGKMMMFINYIFFVMIELMVTQYEQ